MKYVNVLKLLKSIVNFFQVHFLFNFFCLIHIKSVSMNNGYVVKANANANHIDNFCKNTFFF
jgi:hypothetical protein